MGYMPEGLQSSMQAAACDLTRHEYNYNQNIAKVLLETV